MAGKKSIYPTKRSMNLYYKPDRTSRPATIALYVLFALVSLLGLSKIMLYDLWAEVKEAEDHLAWEEEQLETAMAQLEEYAEVQERYFRYSATELEQQTVDRMEVLRLLDGAVGSSARIDNISISGDTVQLRFSGVNLAQTAQIVKALEASPIVESTMVNTAATQELDGQVLTSVLIQLKKEGMEE